jgi:predicted ferric reductase
VEVVTSFTITNSDNDVIFILQFIYIKLDTLLFAECDLFIMYFSLIRFAFLSMIQSWNERFHQLNNNEQQLENKLALKKYFSFMIFFFYLFFNKVNILSEMFNLQEKSLPFFLLESTTLTYVI